MTEIIQFDIEDVDVIEEQEDSQFATLKIDAFASGDNKHGLYISEETLKKTASTILQKPIVWLFDKTRQDATAHSELEVPCGFVPHDSPIEYRTLSDGRIMMTVVGRVWKRYSGKIIEIFKRDGKKKSVSVEMEVLEHVQDVKTGFAEILDFIYLCITILGEGVKPAIPLAHAEMVAFATKEKKEYEEALLEFSSKYKDIDLTIPENIKKNAEKGLSLYKEMGSGATSVSLATARFIGKNLTISPEKVRHVYKYLNSHKNKPKDKKSPDYISWLMHGGDTAYDWAKDLVEKLEEVDNKRTSYFNESENMGEFSPKEELSVKNEKELEKKEEEMASEEPKEEPKEEEKKEEEMSSEEPKEEEKKEEKMSDEEESKDEEKEETDEEEEKEEEKTEKMSLDSNLDMAALLAMLSDETEDYAKLVASHQSGTMDYSVLCSAMFTKMCKMAEEMKANTDAYMSENQTLKEFKTSVEAERFAFEIESTLSEVGGIMPKEEVINAREDSKNFSVETVDAWKNKTKALAFTFAKTGKTEDKPKKVGLPFVKTDTMHSSSPWKR